MLYEILTIPLLKIDFLTVSVFLLNKWEYINLLYLVYKVGCLFSWKVLILAYTRSILFWREDKHVGIRR